MKLLDYKLRKDLFSIKGMTLIEVLLVVSMVSVLSLALFRSFSAGVKIWQKSRQLVKEEDIAVFLDKLSHDLRNAYRYSLISPEGDQARFLFPSTVYTVADPRMGLPENTYIYQMGSVEYYYDFENKNICRRQFNYGQTISKKILEPIVVVSGIDLLEFQYHYQTDSGEKTSKEVLEYMPFGVSVVVKFFDKSGDHTLQRYIDVPLNS